MAKDWVQFGYALVDDSNHLVSIDDIDRQFSLLHKFFCPYCHKEMYATFGMVQMPHFRHIGEKCQHNKYLHELAERVFIEEYEKCLVNGEPFILDAKLPVSCNRACVLKNNDDCLEHYIKKTVDLTQEYTLISPEHRVEINERYRRPDILLESFDGKQLWVEIWVSHETIVEKQNDGRIIEIKIETEGDLETIKQHRIVQSKSQTPIVRTFNIELGYEDVLFINDLSESSLSLPCEKLFCFEMGAFGPRASIVDINYQSDFTVLSYSIILRLNWEGKHDIPHKSIIKHVDDSDLYAFCLNRFYSFEEEGDLLHHDNPFESLIVSEWRANKPQSIQPSTVQKSRVSQPGTVYTHKESQPSYFQPALFPISQSTTAPIDVSYIEWVDLGLPSGIRWAKRDVDNIVSFVGALSSFGSHLPSKEMVNELKGQCSKRWDENTHELIFTGPNGKSISFICRESNKSYWLNSFEYGDPGYGQCFHIFSGGHFLINDKKAYSSLFVRLVDGDTNSLSK